MDAIDYELCIERFEQAWRHGARPDIAASLDAAQVDPHLRQQLLLELVKIDLEFQARNCRSGKLCPRIDDYVERFPQLQEDSARMAELIQEEYRVRHRWADRPAADEFQRRFPQLGRRLSGLFRDVDEQLQREAAEGEPHQAPAVTELDLAAARLPLVSYRDVVLQRYLGSGGMGKVYRAVDRRTSEPVAIKMLKKSRQHNRDAVVRLIDEARIVSQLNHPGIVTMQGLGKTPVGGVFLVLEWIDGPDLSRLALGSSLPVSQAVRWVIEAAEAVEHAHQRGVVHCDLKPSNLLQRSTGEIVLSDFGLARSLAVASEHFARWEGTASFMAPEQIDSSFGPIDRRTDVYGLGAVLFMLLTGVAPYQGKAAFDIIAQILAADRSPAIESPQRPIPPAIIGICNRCLAKNPADRFPTVQALTDALRTYIP